MRFSIEIPDELVRGSNAVAPTSSGVEGTAPEVSTAGEAHSGGAARAPAGGGAPGSVTDIPEAASAGAAEETAGAPASRFYPAALSGGAAKASDPNHHA
jgi:hypothetical protein